MKYSIYSGAGNDFVMINNWDNRVPFNQQKDFTVKICDQKFKNIDGVIFLSRPLGTNVSIRMNYYNRDGSYGAMCGNGARCIALFAADEVIVNVNEFVIEAVDKLYRAEIKKNHLVKIHFPPPDKYDLNIKLEETSLGFPLNVHWLHVGSEHIVLFMDDEFNKKAFNTENLDAAKINEWGKELRFNKYFQPKGANVNFAGEVKDSEIRIRTYERGVERETLACGTGIISSAIVTALLGKASPPVNVLVQSGEKLIVDFINDGGEISNLSLEGSARKIEEGEL